MFKNYSLSFAILPEQVRVFCE